MEFSNYSSIDQIFQDIKSVKIQGATNVAIATFEGMKLFVRQFNQDVHPDVFLAELEQTAVALANARPNEPLAKNGVKYVFTMFKIQNPNPLTLEETKTKVMQLTESYLEIVKLAKENIVANCINVLDNSTGLLTHCHSSTAEKLIIEHAKTVSDFKVVCSETRPLMQGHITAKNLLSAGLDTTMVVDSAIASFIIGRGSFKVDAVLLGADQISITGDTVNKIGSWAVAQAAYFASIPVYVVSSFLKVDVSTLYRPIKIEMRSEEEVWADAPDGLKIVNPAFEVVDNKFISGFLTEIGLILPGDIQRVISEKYGWLY